MLSQIGDDTTEATRRRYLKYSAAAVSGGALSGCSGGASTSEETPTELDTVSAEEYSLVERWLGTEEVGGVDETFDGSIVDARNADNPEIMVGAEGNGGPVSFEPSAMLVSPETVVHWVWTAEGHHNVVSDPEAQLGESDLTFSSGEPLERENNLYTETFDGPATVLYHCEPHLDLGMKGAIVVEPME
jgi:halocyanin-like protein